MKKDKKEKTLRKNYFNVYKFSMDLRRPAWPHQYLDLEVVSFFGSNEGDVCDSTFNLYLDKGMGKGDDYGDGEKVLCEDVSISQLERFYNFLGLVLNKQKERK